MLATSGLLAILAIGLLVVLVKAVSQNRSLWHKLRASGRPVGRLVRDALVLWSPLGLLIVLLAFAANRLIAISVEATYRLTTLDRFCTVEGMPESVLVPCTGMDAVLAPQLVRPAGVQVDLEHFVAEQFRRERQRWLTMEDPKLGAAAASRGTLKRELEANAVLGLETAPEDDPELHRLKLELREILRTPTPPARDLLDVVRFVTERDARIQRMRALTAQVRARREFVNDAAYGGLTSAEQAPLWLRHRLARLLSTNGIRQKVSLDASLNALVSARITGASALHDVRRGIVTTLARNEALAADVLKVETSTPKGIASLYLALPIPRQCTVASANPALRLRASDFDSDALDMLEPDALLQENSGTFACFKVSSPRTLYPRSFRESVRLSIDRWYDALARDSVRRLGKLSATPEVLQGDSGALARAMSTAVPAEIHLGRMECSWSRPVNCSGNLLRAAIEDGYASARAEAVARAQAKTAAASTAASASLDHRIGERLLLLDAQLQEMRTSAQAYATRLFLLHDLLRIIGWLIVALIAIKSYLYVLSLELFHSEQDLSLGFEDAALIQGSFRSGRQLMIDTSFRGPLVTRKQLSNADNNVRLAPWPWSAPIARIFRGRYFIFTKGRYLADATTPGDGAPPSRGMIASAPGGQSIVEWIMQPGEEVIFRYKEFYGASENVRLTTEISFRLSTLLLGRIVFRVARCGETEGRLLLKAFVEEIDQQQLRALPPERMIAWSRHARFSVHSGRTLWKTLLNGYTLVRQQRDEGPSGLIVVSSDDVGSNLGSIRFVRRIFGAIF